MQEITLNGSYSISLGLPFQAFAMEDLLQQPFVKEPSITVAELFTESSIVLA